MAAEKLTKGRLAQILFMMTVLIIAFTWRSVTHSNKEILCAVEQDCTVQLDQIKVEFEWQEASKSYRVALLKSNQDVTFKSMNTNAEIVTSAEYVQITIAQYPVKINIKKPQKNAESELYVIFR